MEVFHCALVRLGTEDALPDEENELNRKLLFMLRRENHRLLREGRGCAPPVFSECVNQPIEDDLSRALRESKRPDFTWGFVDLQRDDDVFFVVECKRLGSPTSNNWILNKNYVTNGVRRFVDADWGYGGGVSSAAMIGYLQNMAGDAVLREVNVYAQAEGLAPIAEPERWNDQGVTELGQILERTFRESPLDLRHLWLDLRHRYATTEGAPA